MNAKIYNGNIQPNPKEYKIWVNDEGTIKTWNGTEWIELSGGSGESGSSSNCETNYNKIIIWSNGYTEGYDYYTEIDLNTNNVKYGYRYFDDNKITKYECTWEEFSNYILSDSAFNVGYALYLPDQHQVIIYGHNEYGSTRCKILFLHEQETLCSLLHKSSSSGTDFISFRNGFVMESDHRCLDWNTDKSTDSAIRRIDIVTAEIPVLDIFITFTYHTRENVS